MNIKINSKQLLLFNFFDIDQFSNFFYWNPGKKSLNCIFEWLWATFPKFSDQYPYLECCPGFFCLLTKKIRGDPKKDMGPWTFHVLKSVLNFLLTWGFSAWGVQLAFAFPLPMSPFGRKLDKNWPNGSKNKNLSFFKKNLVRFWRALKRQVFDQKRHFFWYFWVSPNWLPYFLAKNFEKVTPPKI